MLFPDPEQFGFAAGAAGAGTDTAGDAVGVGVTDVGAVVETAVAGAAGAAEVVDADGEGVAGAAAVVDADGEGAAGAAAGVDVDGEGAAGAAPDPASAAAGVDVLAGSTVTAGPEGTEPSSWLFIPLAMVPAPVGALLAGAAPSVLLPQAARTSAAARTAIVFVAFMVPPSAHRASSVSRPDGRDKRLE